MRAELWKDMIKFSSDMKFSRDQAESLRLFFNVERGTAIRPKHKDVDRARLTELVEKLGDQKIVMSLDEFFELADMATVTPWRELENDGIKKDRSAFRSKYFQGGIWTDKGVQKLYKEMQDFDGAKQVKSLQGKAEPEIDVDMIELIHGYERQQDGYITFCRKINDDHQDLAGVRVSKLREILPGMLPLLFKNSYFTVNASYRAAPYLNKITGLPSAWRKENVLLYLNACYVDLDCYKAGLDWADGVRIVMKAQDEDLIPPASIIARSGRGLYLLWLLTSQRQGAQQRAFPHEIELYKQINKTLIHRLNNYDSRLHLDCGAFDAARILRTPGSLNTKASAPVMYIIQATAGGRVPVYTLPELAEFYEIPVTPALPEPRNFYTRAIKDLESCPARRRGRIATGNYRLEDVRTLYQNRRGFEHGRRRRSLIYVARFAKAAGHTLSDIETLVLDLAKGCRPPYPSESNDTPPRDIVRDVWLDRTYRFLNNKLAKFFQVTPELAEELDLRSIIPTATKEDRAARPSPQAQAREERREFIRARFKAGPPCGILSFQRQLEAVNQIAAYATVRADVKAVWSET